MMEWDNISLTLLFVLIFIQTMSQDIVTGVFYMGVGQPLDDFHLAANSYTEYNEGTTTDAAACKSQCDSVASSLDIKGFSFFDDRGDGTNNKCRCWTGGNSEIVSTDGFKSFGYTYCYGCRFDEPSSQPSGQPRSWASDHHSVSESQPSSQPNEMPRMNPSLLRMSSKQHEGQSRGSVREGTMLRRARVSQPSSQFRGQPWMNNFLYSVPSGQHLAKTLSQNLIQRKLAWKI